MTWVIVKVEFMTNWAKDEDGNYAVSPLLAHRLEQGLDNFLADTFNGTQMSDARRAYVAEHALEYDLGPAMARHPDGDIPALMLRVRMTTAKAVEHHMLFGEEISPAANRSY